MSVPASLGRSRADEVANRDFYRLEHVVVNGLRSKLNRAGVFFDASDLRQFYIDAWKTLWLELAKGNDIRNPEGFLVHVAYCRAIDEARGLRDIDREKPVDPDQRGTEHDLEGDLDRQTLLRHFQEGLEEKLTYREYQAARLCLILGLTRPQAARLLNIDRDRIERIMDDATRKIREFVPTIASGDWCHQHESMIRAYALRLHAVGGRRHKLAKAHVDECPRCQRFVLELRHLAPALTPLPLPGAISGSPGGALTHLTHIVARAWIGIRRVVREYALAFKGGGTAGAGAGAGASAGPALVGSGVGAHIATVCAALCVATGAMIVHSGGTAHDAHRTPALARRSHATGAPVAAYAARPSDDWAISAEGPGAEPAQAASVSHTRLTSDAQPEHGATTAVRHTASKPISDNQSQNNQEFGFEGSGAQHEDATDSTPSPPPKASIASRDTTRSAASSDSSSTSQAKAAGASANSSGSSPSSASSEFGFEGG
jgi:DNA-directed RNA polymerase specialized sigma24 family protein